MAEFRWKCHVFHTHQPTWGSRVHNHSQIGTAIEVVEKTLQQKIPAQMVNHKYTREQWVDVKEVRA